MVLVIAPLSLSGMEGRGEDHDSDDNNGYHQNQSGSTVSSYVPNQNGNVGLEGDDRGGENNSGQTPSDRQHCEKTKQKPNRMNIHNTDPIDHLHQTQAFLKVELEVAPLLVLERWAVMLSSTLIL